MLADRGHVGGPPPLGDGDHLPQRQPAELGADPVGGGVAQRVDLVGGGRPGLHRPVPGHPELSERLDRPVAGLRDRLGFAGDDGAGGGLGVERIVLAEPAPLLAVRAVDLEHPDPVTREEPGQAGTPGAAPFDPDGVDVAVGLDPGEEAAVAAAGGRERGDLDEAAELVEHRRDVHDFVGVDTGGDSLRDGGHATFLS